MDVLADEMTAAQERGDRNAFIDARAGFIIAYHDPRGNIEYDPAKVKTDKANDAVTRVARKAQLLARYFAILDLHHERTAENGGDSTGFTGLDAEWAQLKAEGLLDVLAGEMVAAQERGDRDAFINARAGLIISYDPRGNVEYDPASATGPDVGGIDIQNIDVMHKNGGTKIQFNDQAVRDVLKNGFSGFTPVIINITPVTSVLPLLGLVETDPSVPAVSSANSFIDSGLSRTIELQSRELELVEV